MSSCRRRTPRESGRPTPLPSCLATLGRIRSDRIVQRRQLLRHKISLTGPVAHRVSITVYAEGQLRIAPHAEDTKDDRRV